MLKPRPTKTGRSKKSAPAAPKPSAPEERRAEFRQHLHEQIIPGIGADEIEAHFLAMPLHYWERVDESDLHWGLQTIHGFLEWLATPKVSATRPFIDWRQTPGTPLVQVMLCTWDRQGLLAKAAAAFSAVGFNILQADVFTRSDNLLLDRFCVTASDQRTIDSAARLQEMIFLLEGALSNPPRFASVWACSRHKMLAPAASAPVQVEFENAASSTSTLVRVQAPDRVGLLYDLLQTLADNALNVTQAIIQTESGTARDTIYVQDAEGPKRLNPDQFDDLRHRLETALS